MVFNYPISGPVLNGRYPKKCFYDSGKFLGTKIDFRGSLM
jgi:hypothetical protein